MFLCVLLRRVDMLHLRKILETDDRKHPPLTAKDSVHGDVPARLCVGKPGVRTEGTTGDRMGKKKKKRTQEL